MDIHLHTPASADWLEPGTTYLQWLQKAESRGLDIVAITDHNTVEGVARLRAEIERLAWLEANDRLRPQERRDLDEYRRLGDKILVLPGFEFTATFGFHILGVFPPETSLRKLELLLLRLNVPMDRLAEGITEVGPTTDVLTAYRMIREAGGLVIAAHANSTHGVALQGMSFGGQTRIAFTQDSNLHALEVTDLDSAARRSTLRFFDGSKPEYPRRMHLLQGSDAHRLSRDPRDKNRLGVGDRVTEILLTDVSFEAFRSVLEGNDFTLMRPYRPPAEEPFDHVQSAREQGPNIVQAFHESMARDGGALSKVLCDVVAFANTCGGTMYVGAPAGKGPAKGVEMPDIAAMQLKKEIERNVTPPLDVSVDVLRTQGVPVLRAVIPNGPDKPYALGQTRVYIREEGETTEAVRDELVQLVLEGRKLAEVAEATEVAAPAPEPEVPAEPAKPEPRRPRGTPAPSRPRPAEQRPAPPAPEPAAAEAAPVSLPTIGVELVSMDERKGGRYFAIRDLRNGNVVQNVTIHSARKLWSYAINQHMTHPNGPDNVTWRGDLGLWQAARRAKKLRYDLALRMPDGKLRVFYGVTADGMTGPWAQFLLEEDRPEGESDGFAPVIVISEEPDEEGEFAAEPVDILAPPENGDRSAAEADAGAPAKSRSRRGRRGGRGRGKGGQGAGLTGAEEMAEEAGVFEEPLDVPAPEPVAVEPVAQAEPKPRRTRKPKAAPPPADTPVAEAPVQEAASLVDAVVADAMVQPEAVTPEPEKKPRSRSRAKKPAAEPVVEAVDAAPAQALAPEAVVVAEPVAVVDAAPAPEPKPKAPRKPKTPQAEASRSMPEAIGQAPKRKPRKPKEPVNE
ncbi:MAG: putative DNA binding domain-containing protein [Anaerolineae bacterium]|nr:putative DNA binding domain-containing protein [Anaerolineae bacterium]